MRRLLLWGIAMGLFAGQVDAARGAEKIKVLIIDGENAYHDWRTTTPLLQRLLRESGRFDADVATVPESGDAARVSAARILFH